MNQRDSKIPEYQEPPPQYERTPGASDGDNSTKTSFPDDKKSPFNDASGPSPSSLTAHVLSGSDKEIIYHYRTVFLVDDSVSMLHADVVGTVRFSRWAQAQESIEYLASVVLNRGMDVEFYFLNAEEKGATVKASNSPSQNGGRPLIREQSEFTNEIKEVFDNAKPAPNSGSATPTGSRIDSILKAFAAGQLTAPQPKSKFKMWPSSSSSQLGQTIWKGLNLIVFTDGAADDDVADVIMHNLCDLSVKVGIQFVQVGADPGVTAFLRSLDDNLQKKGFMDVVDTVRLPTPAKLSGNPQLSRKILLGGVDRQVDSLKSHYLKWLKPRTKRAKLTNMEVEQLREDALMRLAKYETVFLLDDSWSMTEGDPSRWEQTVKACTSLAANVSRYSPDGFEIRTLNCGRSGRCKSAADAQELIGPVSPSGSTPLGERLTEILEAYDQKLYATMDFTMKRILRSPLPKPLNCIVITDGKPDNQRLVEDLIIETATRLKDTRAPLTQIGIQFVQIGDDKNASEWLEKLDDKIKVWDIVDTCRYKSSSKKVDFEKILLGAINRRIDKLQKT